MNNAAATRNERRDEASALVGELVRDGETVFYINTVYCDGRPTGRTKEFASHGEAVRHLMRNGYV